MFYRGETPLTSQVSANLVVYVHVSMKIHHVWRISVGVDPIGRPPAFGLLAMPVEVSLIELEYLEMPKNDWVGWQQKVCW